MVWKPNTPWTANSTSPKADQSYPNGDRGQTPQPSGDRFAVSAETTADFYVSSTGSNGNAGTSEGAAWATLAYALQNSSAGDEIMVVDDIIESIECSVIVANGGTSGAHKVIKGKTINTKITGAITDTGYAASTNTYIDFKNLWFDASTSQEPTTGPLHYCTFFRCMFSGGQLSGNVVKFSSGSYQLYEQCGWFGPGGRYNFLAYQQTNITLRHCIGRSDSGWGDGSEPDANFQVYSSTNVNVIQCVGFDSQQRSPSYGYLAEFSATTNQGPNTNVRFINTYAIDGPSAGFTVEGNSGSDTDLEYCVALNCEAGVVENDQGGGSTVITGGEFSNNSSDGLASYGSATTSMGSPPPNCVGNGSEQNRYWGGTETNNALSLTNPFIIGGLLAGYGDAAEETEQAETLFTENGEFLSAAVQAMFKAPMETVRAWSQTNLGAIVGV